MSRTKDDASARGAAGKAAGPIQRIKWWMFRLLERLSDLKGSVTRPMLDLSGAGQVEDAFWLFASTIGELNAIEPLLRRLLAEYPEWRLVIISDHEHYEAAFRDKYPQAALVSSKGHSRDAAELCRVYRPRLFLVAEIPCALTDAPCRLSYAFVRAARRAGARCILVNGWLYGYKPASRMDAIEADLFGLDYVLAFDRICVQTESVREALLERCQHAVPIEVTGNIKFDAIHPEASWSIDGAKSPGLLGGFEAHVGPVIVAGCVTAYPEQELVLDAFVRLRARWPTARLVIAPRHAEFRERMAVLRAFLEDRGLNFVFRSDVNDEPLGPEVDGLVLDTVGELVDFYALASAAHVGRNHNILEPLRFGKLVTVLPDWDPTFPSFPTYLLAKDKALLSEMDSAEAIAGAWTSAFADDGKALAASDVIGRLREAQGATDQVMGAIRDALR